MSSGSRIRSGHIAAILTAMVIVALLLAPDIEYGTGGGNLTTYSAGPFGARGFLQTMERLGWPVQQRTTRFRPGERSDVTYVILEPPLPPGARETSALLDAVRRGATLLVVPQAGTPLADSLGVRTGGWIFAGTATATASAPEELDYEGSLRRPLEAPPDSTLPAAFTPLLDMSWSGGTRRAPAIGSMQFGSGHILLVGDATFLSNDRLRNEEEAVLAVRLVGWLEGARGRRPLVFSEWHHGRGAHADPGGVLRDALVGTAPGRALLVLLLAGGALLFAIGARPVAPEPAPRIERRSPFEHVGALSVAYRQIGGTRLATRHLVRGLRRRRAAGIRQSMAEREFLIALRERHPQLAPQVALVLEALEVRVEPEQFVRVGEAVHIIERTITQ